MFETKFWGLGALWVVVAALMPMAAVDSVACARTASAPVAPLCPDGSMTLALGCESIYL